MANRRSCRGRRPSSPNPTSSDFFKGAARNSLSLSCQEQPANTVSMSSSSSSAALGGSHAGLALAATAMALSGTLVLFSLCRAKQADNHLVSSDASPSPARLRPCLSSSEKRKREKARRGSMKRVRFADDVIDNGAARPAPVEESEPSPSPGPSCRGAAMPANREALYRGMLRGRSMLRTIYSY